MTIPTPENVGLATLVFSTLLAIVNPIGAIPLYLALTAGYDEARRRSTVRLAIATALIALVVFGLAGTWILKFFGITTTAFRITGGILFLGIGMDMMQARRPREKGSPREDAEAGKRDQVGVLPLGIPLLAGPGAITTVITLTAQTDRVGELAAVYAAIFGVMATSWLILAVAPRLFARLGSTGLNVLTRLMGLLAMVVGVQFIIDGVRSILEPMLK